MNKSVTHCLFHIESKVANDWSFIRWWLSCHTQDRTRPDRSDHIRSVMWLGWPVDPKAFFRHLVSNQSQIKSRSESPTKQPGASYRLLVLIYLLVVFPKRISIRAHYTLLTTVDDSVTNMSSPFTYTLIFMYTLTPTNTSMLTYIFMCQVLHVHVPHTLIRTHLIPPYDLTSWPSGILTVN